MTVGRWVNANSLHTKQGDIAQMGIKIYPVYTDFKMHRVGGGQ